MFQARKELKMRALLLTAVFMATVGIALLGSTVTNLIAQSQGSVEAITLQQSTTPILLAEGNGGSGGG